MDRLFCLKEIFFHIFSHSVLNKLSENIHFYISKIHYFIHFCWLLLKSLKAFSISLILNINIKYLYKIGFKMRGSSYIFSRPDAFKLWVYTSLSIKSLGIWKYFREERPFFVDISNYDTKSHKYWAFSFCSAILLKI